MFVGSTTRRARVALVALSLAALSMSQLIGCDEAETSSPAAPLVDGGSVEAGDAAGGGDGQDAGGGDGRDAGGDAGCVEPCYATAVSATFGGTTRALDLAHFGRDGETLRVEIHGGAAPGCPSGSTPTPDRTVVVAGVRPSAPGAVLTEADGLAATLLDYADELGLPPVVSATSEKVTFVASDPATPPGWIAIDVELVFASGTVAGRVYAEHCASLD